MSRLRTRRSSKSGKNFLLQKANGQLNPRVEKVGPEHFGIVAIDCAKARSRYLLADFYGRALLPPTTLPHNRGDFQAALQRLRQAIAEQMRQDLEVAVTHLPAKVRAEEAKPLRQHLDELAKRRGGTQPLAKIIPLVLARLAERVVKSKPEGEGP